MKAGQDKTFAYCLLGSQILLKHLQALMKENEGVRKAETIDPVHDMRVASRRMRAGFTIFGGCFPAGQFSKWQKEIRRVTRRLGEARDLDVQKDYLTQLMAGLTAGQKRKRAGIVRLYLRLSQRRERAQPGLIEALDRLDSSGVLGEMEQAFGHLQAQARIRKAGKSSPYVYEQARSLIEARLEDMLAYESFVTEPERKEELHQMRIEAKRLRYTMEYFESCYEGKLKSHVKNARQAQTLLGQLHDCDVWIEFLPRFIEEERLLTIDYFGEEKPFEHLRPGLAFIVADRQRCRKDTYEEFLACWQAMDRGKVWKKLLQTLNKFVESRKKSKA
jgi:CHAD domain-containing protein